MKGESRGLTTVDAVALTVGSMVGAGIFSVLALTVQTAGPAAVLSWVLIVVLSFPMALTFSDLTGVLSESGGPYVYIRKKTSKAIGLWVAWLFLVSAAGAAAALLMALVGMMSELGVTNAFVVGCFVLMVLSLVTALGIRLSTYVQRVLTVGTVVLLVFCIVAGLGHMNTALWHVPARVGGFAAKGWWSVLPAAFFAFWTYSGWEAVSVPSGSYTDRRHLANGMLIGSLLVGVLYILVAFAAVISVPAQLLERYTNPLVLVGQLWGTWAAVCIGYGALIVVIGSLLSWLIATASLLQALVRDGLLPAPSFIREFRGEYHRAVPIAVGVVLMCLSALPIFSVAIAASSMTALIAYGLVFAVVVQDKDNWSGVISSLPRRRFVAAIALCMVLLLIVSSGWRNLWPTLVLCIAGLVLVQVRKHRGE